MSKPSDFYALVDSSLLVYRWDPRFPDKQERVNEILRRGITDQPLCISHQGLVELVGALVRKNADLGRPLLTSNEACREAEELTTQFTVLYPTEEVLITAFRGAALYPFPWLDAHLWAYAESYGLPRILTEDYDDGVRFGTVEMCNPFSEAAPA